MLLFLFLILLSKWIEFNGNKNKLGKIFPVCNRQVIHKYQMYKHKNIKSLAYRKLLKENIS